MLAPFELDGNARRCAEAETDTIKRATTCLHVFKLLRNDTTEMNPHRHSLYLDYKAFKVQSNPICEKKFTRISQNIVGEHMSLTCYNRLAVITNTTEYHKEISILFGPRDSVIVFRCLGNPYCELIEWFEKIDGIWFSELPVSFEKLAARNVPEIADVEELDSIFQQHKNKVYCMSLNNSHFIHNMESDDFAVLCRILLNRPKYTYKARTKFIDISQNKNNKFYDLTVYYPFIKIETLLERQHIASSERTFTVKAYPCNQYLLKQRKSRSFKIMAGRTETSVIILEPTICNNKDCLVPAELIENLDLNYIQDIEDYF